MDDESVRALCERLGIKPRDLDVIRRDALDKGVDYYWSAGRHFFRPSGVRKIEAVVRGPGEVNEDPPAAAPAEVVIESPSLEPQQRVLWVERLCPNPIWVQCRDAGVLVNVRVWNNRILRRGQALTVMEDGDGRMRALRVRG